MKSEDLSILVYIAATANILLSLLTVESWFETRHDENTVRLQQHTMIPQQIIDRVLPIVSLIVGIAALVMAHHTPHVALFALLVAWGAQSASWKYSTQMERIRNRKRR